MLIEHRAPDCLDVIFSTDHRFIRHTDSSFLLRRHPEHREKEIFPIEKRSDLRHTYPWATGSTREPDLYTHDPTAAAIGAAWSVWTAHSPPPRKSSGWRLRMSTVSASRYHPSRTRYLSPASSAPSCQLPQPRNRHSRNHGRISWQEGMSCAPRSPARSTTAQQNSQKLTTVCATASEAQRQPS